MLLMWLKKCADDSEVCRVLLFITSHSAPLLILSSSFHLLHFPSSQTSNWIAANTKVCPKCKSTIEKNGGCNHMTCNNSGCRVSVCV